MNSIKKYFTWIVIAVLAIIILLQRCGDSVNNTDQININGTKYNIIKKEVRKTIVPVVTTVTKPGTTIYKEVPIYINPELPVDTAAILREFFSIVVYKDTIKLKDSLGVVYITDSITKNSILNRQFTANVNKIQIDSTIYLEIPPRNQVYIGGNLGVQKPDNLLAGAGLVLKTKRDKMFSLGVGYNSNLNLFITGGMYWKISLRKK